MAFIERFSKIIRGGLVFTGNTLGLSKLENKNASGKIGSIGAFISLDKSQTVPTFPQGTTLNYEKNGSSAILNLPEYSEILYAELIWSGVSKVGNKDLTNALKSPITFISPKGEYQVNGEHRTKQNKIVKLNNLNFEVYVRSANVTQVVKTALSGEYGVKSVPSFCLPLDEETGKTNFAGWTLAVAFKNPKLNTHKLNIMVGCEVVYSSTGSKDVPITGFEIPLNGVQSAKLHISSGEGDAMISGDSLLYGKDTSSLVKTYGNNNEADNFFASQINDSNGNLDESGTFGFLNQNAKTKQNIDGGRQGWDITAVDIKRLITSNHTSPVVRFLSTGDMYFPNAIGLEVNHKSADLVVRKRSDKSSIIVGEEVSYTIEVENVGDITAQTVELKECLPEGLLYVADSLYVDGEKRLSTFFPLRLNDISPGQTRIITFKMYTNEMPKTLPITNTATVDYSYTVTSGETIYDSSLSNPVNISISQERIKITKTVDKEYAVLGEVLSYTNEVENIGHVNLQNIVFKDTIPNFTTFVEGSVVVDGYNFKSYNPIEGFNIGALNVGDKVTVTFQVKINSK